MKEKTGFLPDEEKGNQCTACQGDQSSEHCGERQEVQYSIGNETTSDGCKDCPKEGPAHFE
jgi:hypothetical protein